MAGSWLAAIGRATPDIRQAITDIQERPKQEERWKYEKAMMPLGLEQAKQQTAIGGAKVEGIKREDERRKKPISFMSGPIKEIIDADPEHGQKITQWLKENYGLNEAGQMTQGNSEDALKAIALSNKLQDEMMLPVVKSFEKKASGALQKYNETKEKNPNDPKLPELWGQYQAQDQKYKQYSGMYSQMAEQAKIKKEMDTTIQSFKDQGIWDSLSPNTRAILEDASKTGNKDRFDKAAIEIVKAGEKVTKPKTIEKTVDLGDRVRYHYTDGTYQDIPKGKTPAQKEKEKVGKEQVDKMFRQYNVARLKSKDDPIRQSMALMMANMGVIIDPTKDFPALTREQFEVYVNTGTLPTQMSPITKPTATMRYQIPGDPIPYDIPQDRESAFLKAHPNAKKLTPTPQKKGVTPGIKAIISEGY